MEYRNLTRVTDFIIAALIAIIMTLILPAWITIVMAVGLIGSFIYLIKQERIERK